MANASLLKLWGLLFGSTDQNDASVEKILENLGLGTAATSDVSDYTPAGQAYTKSESNELFQPLDSTLTALATLVGAANKLPYFNGVDSAALTDLTAVGRDIIGKATAADILTYLQLGEAAKRDVGTASNQIPDMTSFTHTIIDSQTQVFTFPNGMMLQTGLFVAPNYTGTLTFPVPFPTQILAIAGMNFNSTSGDPSVISSYGMYFTGSGNTSISISSTLPNKAIRYIAVGV